MRPGRYQVRGDILINAPIERVFDVASDPRMVPQYADEIARIDVLERRCEREAIVRSILKLGPLRLAFRYRDRYRRPRMYAGFQERGLLRGYFSFSFRAEGQRTRVRHVEGLESLVPGLALLVVLFFFRLLGRGDLTVELARLADLASAVSRQASPAIAPSPVSDSGPSPVS